MDARQFFERFIEVTDKERIIAGNRLFDIYRSNSGYTSVITGILNEMVDEAGYTHQNEYFRIDVVGWVSRYKEMEADANAHQLNAHFWDLKIAIEHENSSKDWSDEVIKLIHVKCPLKVIIGYSPHNIRQEKQEFEKLDYIAKWMNKVDAFKNGDNEEYLIILGNAKGKGRGAGDYDSFDYRGYLYNADLKRFERI